MRFSKLSGLLAMSLATVPFLATATPTAASHVQPVKRATVISPKVFIISMFISEARVWYGIPDFNVLAQNITVPGFSPLFPQAHCTSDGQICQMTTGEGEINAATSISALVLSPDFNLTQTYFMVAGIAGVNPEVATIGSVTFAKYAVQVALQYEFDAREIPSNFTTGYVPQGAESPTGYPQSIYGTEVFEVSGALQQIAINFAKTAVLNDSSDAQSYRALYASASIYASGAAAPTVVGCDVATSDVYFSGSLLGEAFGNTTSLFSNGSAIYCTTAQEDNATLEALLRSSQRNLTDFTRIIIMRTASDFDRPPPGISAVDNLLYIGDPGYPPSVRNIYRAGVKVVEGIVGGWDTGYNFSQGVSPGGYVGDIFGSLGPKYGRPTFGLPSEWINGSGGGMKKRGLESSRRGMEESGRLRRKKAAVLAGKA